MKWLLTLFSFVQIFHVYGQNGGGEKPVNHLYLEWKHVSNTIILGHFASNNRKRIPTYRGNINQLTKADIDTWLANTGTGALLLFHCMWGQQRNFHQHMYLGSIDKILTTAPTSGIRTEISVIWHAGGVNYLSNYSQAAAKGEPLANAVLWIAAHYKDNMHVMAHSMGSRFFEGALRNMPKMASPIFKSIIFFSSDLDNNTDDADFANCVHATNAIIVFIHRKDRVLLASSLMHGKKRLGRSGPDKPLPNLQVIDMTEHIIGLQNHTHLNKAWVQQQLSEHLEGGRPMTDDRRPTADDR